MQGYKIIASGHVQGVFFRATAQKIAQKMHLSGYAKNLPSGDVEMVICGSKDDARTILERIQHALSAGKITSYTIHSVTLDTEYTTFETH